MTGDASFDKVKLLVPFSGADGSTSFPDLSLSARVPTVSGSAAVTSAKTLFSNNTGYFNGASYLSYPDSADWQLGAGAGTIEAWVMFSSVTTGAIQRVCGQLLASGAGLVNSIYLTGDGKVGSAFFTTASTFAAANGTSTPAANTWIHVEVVTTGTALKLFVNGTKEAETSHPGFASSSSLFCIGRHGEWASDYFTGYLAQFRFTKGAARHSSDFTPPAAPFPNYAGQIIGSIYDDSGAACSRTVRAYDRATGSLIGVAVSDPVTGIYTLNCPSLNEAQRVVLDDVGGTLYNDIIDRVIPA